MTVLELLSFFSLTLAVMWMLGGGITVFTAVNHKIVYSKRRDAPKNECPASLLLPSRPCGRKDSLIRSSASLSYAKANRRRRPRGRPRCSR
ncbi:hypothetical protein HDG32_007336 [Paraburkholderia sp. CI2]|nr:hypothetical protein [Paraburkholderia sp. CI2]